MSSTVARLFLSKTLGKVILPEYSLPKESAQRQLHKLCRSLVTVSAIGERKNNHSQAVPSHQHHQSHAERRRPFHASAFQSVVFKSKYKIDVPKQDFFSYILGDISGHEEDIALVCGLTGRKYTYAKLKDYCVRVGVSMLERGYRKGDVIAIYSPNVPEYVFTILGKRGWERLSW